MKSESTRNTDRDSKKRSRMDNLVGGGFKDLLGEYRCVVQLRDDNLSKGSGVLLTPRWVLTAAHCVASPPSALKVRNIYGGPEYNVEAIHWQSGYTFLTNDEGSWPEAVEAFIGANDELALLELTQQDAVQCVEPERLARLARGSSPHVDDYLVIAGWGKDAVGNTTKVVRVAVARHVGTASTGRGILDFRRTDLCNGMPRGNDSGAPIFFPSPRYPEDYRYRLAGIHASRDQEVGPEHGDDPLAEGGKGRYLPIRAQEAHWIRRNLNSHEKSPKSSAVQQALRADVFEYRDDFFCWKLKNPSVLCKKVDGVTPTSWTLSATKGSILKRGATVTITESDDPEKFQLRIAPSPGGNPPRILDVFVGGFCGQNHFLRGADRDRVVFYVFHRTLDQDGKRWIWVEAYKGNSAHKEPNCNNFNDDDFPDDCCPEADDDQLVMRSRWWDDQDDQDDDGNGKED